MLIPDQIKDERYNRKSEFQLHPQEDIKMPFTIAVPINVFRISEIG